MFIFSIIKKRQSQAGFTLIEIIICLGILAVLISLGLFMNVDTYKSYTLSFERDTLVGALERARAESLNNMFEMPHGIHFESGVYTLFKGDSYNFEDSYNEKFSYGPSMVITSPEDIIFEQLSGKPYASSTIILRSGVRNFFITINDAGTINW